MKKITLALLCLLFSHKLFAQTIQTESTIESIGYTITNLGSYSSHISVTSRFRVASGTWRNGYEPTITTFGGAAMIAGSFFELAPNATYDIEITIVDSTPSISTHIITTTAITMAEPVFGTPTDTLWVSPTGSGNLFSYASPGRFDQIFTTYYTKVKCGTIILCRGGVYYTGDLQFNMTNVNCSGNNRVTIMSAPNEHAIFDGSDTTTLASHPNWVLSDATAGIYSVTLNQADSFSTLFMVDTNRLFPYATKKPGPLIAGTYYESLSNSDSFFGPGFYRDGNNFFVRLAGGADPTGKKITVSKRRWLLFLYNTNYNMHFTFKNVEMRYYGRPKITNFFGTINGEYSATALLLWNMKGTIIDSCTFNYNTFALTFNYSFDSTIIQNSQFKDVTGFWSHGAYKNSALNEHYEFSYLNDPGKWGRILETEAVWFDAQNTNSKAVIIRNNTFDGFVSAIAGRSDTTGETHLVYGSDIYDNVFKNNYNVVVPPGNVINFLFFRNRVSNFLVGLSLIDNAIGPLYMFRNVFEEMSGRDNPANIPTSYNPGTYINYNGCLGLKNKTWTSILKLNAGKTVLNKRYDLHLIHNTAYSTDSLGYNLYLWEQNWRNIKCVNNSFNATYCMHNFENPDTNTTFQFHSYNDNFYSAGGFAGAANPHHGNTNCYNDNNLDSLTKHLRFLSGNNDTTSLSIRGYEFMPDFVSASGHDFHLNNTSQMIDKGVIVNNISDVLNTNYFGGLPDIGRYENPLPAASVTQKTLSTKNFIVYPNPTAGSITISINENLRGTRLIVRNVLGQQINQTQILKDKNTLVTIEGSSGIYFVELTSENEKPVNFKVIKE
jgi:hypothetical protein